MWGTNLKNTNANLDPRRIHNKKLDSCNLEGVDLSQADFTDVSVQGANLKGTKAVINPQKLKICCQK